MTTNITIMPSENQFDALRVEQTAGANRGIFTDDLVATLMKIDERFGVDLKSVGPALSFELRRIPTGQPAIILAEHLSTFCPDSYWTPEHAMRAIERGKIDLWWD